MKKIRFKNYVIRLVICLITIQAQAQLSELKILPDDTNRDQEFGHAVSVAGDYAAFSSINDDDNGDFAGAVYVYENGPSGWQQKQKLIADDTDVDDSFGYSVSVNVNGNRLAIGAIGVDTSGLSNSGAVYIFERINQTWTQTYKIIADNPQLDARFGTAVSIEGDNLVIGSPGVNSDTGAAFVYHYDDSTQLWSQQEELVDNDATADDNFGFSVSLFGQRVLVGVNTGIFNIEGYATLFENLSNNQQTTFSANDATSANGFGYSVSLHANRAIIGAIYDSSTGGRSGSAYLFEYDSDDLFWQQTQKFTTIGAMIGGTNNANFGNSVSLYQDRVLVGNLHGRVLNSPVGTPGLAFIFAYDGTNWQRTLLQPSDPGTGGQFGFAVALTDQWIVVGANHDNNGIQNPLTGSVSIIFEDIIFKNSFD